VSPFNLSEWSIRNRSVVIYLMIAIVVAGVLSFLHLGRAEDPAFTIRTMVVQAQWPGATLDETLLQVTERLERTLQEVPYLDVLRSYTTAGRTVIFVDLLGTAQGPAVKDTWYEVRKKIGDIRQTLPPGIVGPFFNDEFGDTYGTIYGFTADGFTFRELRDYVENIRSELLKIPDVSKIDVLGAQDEVIYVDFSLEKLAGLGIDPNTLTAALQAQNIVRPSGVLRTGNETISLQVSGAFTSEQDILDVNFAAGGRILRPTCAAATPTRRSRCSESTASRRSASPLRCATAATSWRSAATSRRRWRGSPPICRSASSQPWLPTRPRSSITRSPISLARCGRRSSSFSR
jgi:multidrug efflux pump